MNPPWMPGSRVTHVCHPTVNGSVLHYKPLEFTQSPSLHFFHLYRLIETLRAPRSDARVYGCTGLGAHSFRAGGILLVIPILCWYVLSWTYLSGWYEKRTGKVRGSARVTRAARSFTRVWREWVVARNYLLICSEQSRGYAGRHEPVSVAARELFSPLFFNRTFWSRDLDDRNFGRFSD